jgi:hypothetical protein
MDWWVLELIVTGILVAIVFVLGPLIKRFGRSYAADVFVENPRTGKSYLVLMDIAYYLIFVSYILFTTTFDPPNSWGQTVNASQLQDELVRVGGMLLIMGLLHGLNVLILPIVGKLFSLNHRIVEDTPRPNAA